MVPARAGWFILIQHKAPRVDHFGTLAKAGVSWRNGELWQGDSGGEGAFALASAHDLPAVDEHVFDPGRDGSRLLRRGVVLHLLPVEDHDVGGELLLSTPLSVMPNRSATAPLILRTTSSRGRSRLVARELQEARERTGGEPRAGRACREQAWKGGAPGFRRGVRCRIGRCWMRPSRCCAGRSRRALPRAASSGPGAASTRVFPSYCDQLFVRLPVRG